MFGIIQTLPLALGWLGCYFLFRELAARRQIDADWRLSFALASAGWATILTLIIEVGSLLRALTAITVWTAWMAVAAGLLFAACSLARQRGVLCSDALIGWWRNFRATAASDWPIDARCFLAATIAIAAFLFGIAVMFPTTNWDSLTYHLPRVMHWVQNQSIEHFPTNNSRQIEFGPWSSFVSMTLYLLSGNDRLINLVQWAAMAATLVLVGFMVVSFGHRNPCWTSALRSRATSFACLVAVTIPIGLVESVNPQTDYTAAFWLCCLAWFALALIREPTNPWYVLGAGMACGLGTLTKATMYVYAAPLIVGFGAWWLFRTRQFRMTWRLGAVFCSVFFLINSGHSLRNYFVFGQPLGSQQIMAIERNDRITVSGTTANIVRNLSLYSNSGIPPLTKALNAGFARAHQWTGRSYDDPEITYYIPGFFKLYEKFRVFDSYAGGPYHLAVILLALGLAFRNVNHHRTALWTVAWVVASFVLFCALLKWQYWHMRLHLAYLVLLSPVAGWVLVERLPRWCVAGIAGGLLIFSGFCLMKNQSRPLLDRLFVSLPAETQHLATHGPSWNPPTREITERIIGLGCTNVGLKLEFDEPEYPLWVMLRNRGFDGAIYHVLVENQSRRIACPYPDPDVIIASATRGLPPPPIVALYPNITRFGPLLLLERGKTNETISSATGSWQIPAQMPQ